MPTEDILIRDAIEEAGKIFEKFDLTPMQGRIIAYLTVSDPPEKTFEELVRFFKASKSSVSNSLNYLLDNKLIDYKTYVSDRKRYFYVTDSFFRVYVERIVSVVAELKEHSYRTVSMRSPEYPGATEKLLKWIENANLIEEALQEILKKIREARSA
ncbi:MAG: MarR family transcriptional regulator [Bacteroidales bacterium]|nr:MarR family transcriptional regulator [Bacteroidales bacterium]